MKHRIEFELTDDLAAQAARENWIAHGRKLFTMKLLLLVAVVSVIAIVAILQDVTGWLLVFWTLAPALFALVVVGWFVMYWWIPRAMVKKIAHLSDRHVVVDLNDQQLSVRTAGEQLSVDWENLAELKELTNHCVLRLKGGAEIPIVKRAVSSEALALLREKAARVTMDER